MLTTCVIYTRYSSDTDRQQENSTERQLQECQAFAKRNRWDVLREFSDESVSGDADKPELAKLRELIEAKKLNPDYILITKWDRISRRDIWSMGEDVKWLLPTDVKIQLSDGQVIDPNKPEDQVMSGLAAFSANRFLKDLSANVVSGQKAKLKAGMMPPRDSFGWTVQRDFDEKGKLVSWSLHQTEDAAIIREVFEHFVRTESVMSCVEILKKSPRYADANVRNSTIKSVLRNEKNVGDFAYGRQRVGKHSVMIRGEDGVSSDSVKTGQKKRIGHNVNPEKFAAHYEYNHHAGIVPRELWNRAQEILDENKESNKRKGRSHNFKYSGKLRCHHCGCALSGEKLPSGNIRYRCTNSANRGHECNGSKRVRESFIDEHLGETLLSCLQDWKFHFDELDRRVELAREYMDSLREGGDNSFAAKRDKLLTMKHNYDAAYAAFLDGIGNGAMLRQRQQQIEQLEDEVARLQTEQGYLEQLFRDAGNRPLTSEIATSQDYFDQLLTGAYLIESRQEAMDQLPEQLEAWAKQSGIDDDEHNVEFAAEAWTLVAMGMRLAASFSDVEQLDSSWLNAVESVAVEWRTDESTGFNVAHGVHLNLRGADSDTFNAAVNSTTPCVETILITRRPGFDSQDGIR